MSEPVVVAMETLAVPTAGQIASGPIEQADYDAAEKLIAAVEAVRAAPAGDGEYEAGLAVIRAVAEIRAAVCAERDAEWKEWLYSSDPAGTPAFRALKKAVAEERERCARIAESQLACMSANVRIAAAIRESGE